MTTLIIIAAVLGLAVVAGVAIVNKLVYICQPNEVLVFSGSRRLVGDRVVGYRLVQGGRGLRVPMFERVHRMDLTNMVLDVRVDGAYSKGGIPLNVAAIANVKIASDELTIANAIERLLGKSRRQIIQLAKETLEGNLRGVLATLTPEEVNQDRVKFAAELLQEADQDLKRLGLTLDTLKIQNVSDDRGYLDSLGRRQSAALQQSSRIAEAQNRAVSAERDSGNFEEKEIASIEAKIAVAKAEAARRIADAETRRAALVAEQQAEVTAAVAKTRGEVEVQKARLEQVRLQLQADRIEPAEARRAALVDAARARCAPIVEEGRATATALRTLAENWRLAGAEAPRMMVAQKLDRVLDAYLSTVEAANIERVTVVDEKLTAGPGSLAGKMVAASELLREGAGIDVSRLLTQPS